MHISQHPTHILELRVREVQQLFNSLDPTPFLNKDLDVACEAYIENWALALPHDSRLQLTIHLERLPVPDGAGELIATAIHNHYAFKVELVRGELSRLFRFGRVSFVFGLGFVAICLLSAEVLASFIPGPASRIVRESLTIIGWVAMWRPIQIFLYDWWPLRDRIRTFDTLRFARVKVLPN